MKWRSILGAIWRNLPNEERSALGSNSGVYIELVVKDTPAFRNDVLAGDTLMKIDGVAVHGKEKLLDSRPRKNSHYASMYLPSGMSSDDLLHL